MYVQEGNELPLALDTTKAPGYKESTSIPSLQPPWRCNRAEVLPAAVGNNSILWSVKSPLIVVQKLLLKLLITYVIHTNTAWIYLGLFLIQF